VQQPGRGADAAHAAHAAGEVRGVVVVDEQLGVEVELEPRALQAHAELGVLHGGEREALVEAAHRLERRALERHVRRVEVLRGGDGAGSDAVEGELRPAVVRPVHERGDLAVGPPGDRAEHGVPRLGPRGVQPRVPGEEVRGGRRHVVAEEEHHGMPGLRDAAVAGGGRAGPRLLEHGGRPARGAGAQGGERAVARAVVDHDDLHRAVRLLRVQAVEGLEEHGGPVARRDDDGEAGHGRSSTAMVR